MKDVIIIGAGPIGLACGIEAQQKGLDYLILEKGLLVNSIFHYPRNMTFFSTSDHLEIGNVPFISHQPKPTRSEALEYYRRVCQHYQLALKLYEGVEEIIPEKSGFFVRTAKDSYRAKNIVIASGFYDRPYLLNVPGEDLPKVKHYYDEPHPYFHMDVVVVGAANSAVDVALETYRKGAKSVTMIIRESEIGKNVKYWARPDIVNRIQEGSIQAYFNAEIDQIFPDRVAFTTPQGQQTIPNDFVLAMTGYQPHFQMLESLSVQFQEDAYRTPIYDTQTMESTTAGVYLAGVVCGGLKTNKWFIENSREHAPKIIDHIAQKISD
ncbi:MAG: YpdA family putative bacillithiol disulfide reductase [Flavobacteriaceae bacterium]